MLYLGYDNGPSDGGGAQLHRIMNLYCICRAFRLQYVHFPITGICYKGIHHFENNINDHGEVEAAFNAFLQPNEYVLFPTSLPADIREVKVGELSMEHILKYAQEAKTQNILLRTGLSRPIIERSPDLYRFAPELRPMPLPFTQATPFSVDIHIRRGDVLVVETWRMLPNSYYVNIINLLNALLPRFTTNYTINVHTEMPTKPIVYNPATSGITNQVFTNTIIRPEDSHLEDFNLPNVKLRINEPPIDTLTAFTQSHLFVMSHSSFSVIGAAMNHNGIVLYHPFWHRPASYWLNTEDQALPTHLETKLHALFKSE